MKKMKVMKLMIFCLSIMVWQISYAVSGYYAPYKGGTSQYVMQDSTGSLSHYGNGQGYAIDFAGSFDVYATKEGVVEKVGQDSYKIQFCVDNPQYWHGPANYIRIRHPDGLYSYYFHFSQMNVTVGQQVTRGQKIGVSGNTGCSTSAHLHFQLSNAPNMQRTSSIDVTFDDIGKPSAGYYYTSQNYSNSSSSSVYSSNLQLYYSPISISPSTMVYGSPATVSVSIANLGSTTFQGRISAAVYTMNNTPVNDIALPKQISLTNGYYNTYNFQTSALQIQPGNYILQIEHDSGNDTWVKIPAGNYQNPKTIQIVSGTTSTTTTTTTTSSSNGDMDYCSSSNPCSAGQGDCDSDSECQSGLSCKHNVGASYGFGSSVDMCESNFSPPPPSTSSGGNPSLNNGDWDFCSSSYPCSAGQSDCDNNSECQSGLSCVDNVGASYGYASNADVCEPPPSSPSQSSSSGGNPSFSNGDWDFCSSSYPCGAGQGDCDSDSECQSGLSCVDNVGASYGFGSGVDVCESNSSTSNTGASSSPGSSCGSGQVYDCAMKCVSSSKATSWIGDGWCDNGQYGMDLVCPAFNNDGGDCN